MTDETVWFSDVEPVNDSDFQQDFGFVDVSQQQFDQATGAGFTEDQFNQEQFFATDVEPQFFDQGFIDDQATDAEQFFDQGFIEDQGFDQPQDLTPNLMEQIMAEQASGFEGQMDQIIVEQVQEQDSQENLISRLLRESNF